MAWPAFAETGPLLARFIKQLAERLELPETWLVAALAHTYTGRAQMPEEMVHGESVTALAVTFQFVHWMYHFWLYQYIRVFQIHFMSAYIESKHVLYTLHV